MGNQRKKLAYLKLEKKSKRIDVFVWRLIITKKKDFLNNILK